MDQLMKKNAMTLGRVGNGAVLNGLPLKEGFVYGVNGSTFNNTLSQLQRSCSGAQSHVLFNECTFADLEVSIRCSGCDEHIAWTRDIINKPALGAKSKKWTSFPGCKQDVLVQWIRNKQDANVEVITVCGANVRAKPYSKNLEKTKTAFDSKEEYGKCINCNQQVGWVETDGDETFYALWMSKVTYN